MLASCKVSLAHHIRIQTLTLKPPCIEEGKVRQRDKYDADDDNHISFVDRPVDNDRYVKHAPDNPKKVCYCVS
jgi:hypothetical protein